jgi:GT2 family glycosyltransferase
MSKNVFSASKWSLKKNKLAVLVPCRDMLHAGFSKCLVELVKLNTMNGLDTHVVYDASTVLLTQRARLAAEAQAIGAEYMLWLDSDMIFPPTTALRLLAHNEPVVACNYIRRQLPAKGVAYETIGDWENPLPFEPQDELVPVEGIGMGCMLVKTNILQEIPKPWFEFHWTEESNDHLGEDMDFCMKMADAGYTVKIDTNLSMEMRHLGTWAFGPDLLD